MRLNYSSEVIFFTVFSLGNMTRKRFLCVKGFNSILSLSQCQGFPGDFGERGPAGLDGSPVSTF